MHKKTVYESAYSDKHAGAGAGILYYSQLKFHETSCFRDVAIQIAVWLSHFNEIKH